MNLKIIKDYLKDKIPYENCWFGLYKMDITQDKAICLYPSPNPTNNMAVGGINATGYSFEPIKLLIRWGKDGLEAETKAREIFDSTNIGKFELEGVECYIQNKFSSAQSIGTDDKGIYEYVIDLNFYYERSKGI